MPYGDRMRPLSRTVLPKLGILALAVALSGCTAAPEPAPPTAAPSPTATVAPVFANSEEALTAATAAYAAYEDMATLVFSEGGSQPERLQEVTAGRYEENILQAFTKAHADGLRSTGRTTFDGVRMQRVDEKAPGGVGVVVVYLCSDVSQLDILDASGVSQVPADRESRTALEVGFDWEPGLLGVLAVGSRTVWNGGGVC
jgi:Na+-transporting methylmalonyl-CoA/oxaloacetate decarboxylase gamma subunit